MADTPNILIIHADQHRFDCLGSYGNPDIQTPAIDALAADGVLYENSFCPFPVCTPSRYSLLSGLFVHQHLGWTNRCTLPAGLPTFPRILRDAGYQTKAVGKMHFMPTYLDVGFQEMELAEQDGPGRYDDDYHRWLRDRGLCDRIDLIDQVQEYRKDAPQEYWDTVGALDSDLDEEHHSTTWIAERALETVEQWEDGGNLLMVGFIKPHHPFDPPRPWSRMYDPDALSMLPGWSDTCLERDLVRSRGYFAYGDTTDEQIRRAMAFYYGSISQIDHHVGRMIAELKQKGLYDDTLILYTSDHGDYMGFHHLLLKGNYMYDALVKVPLIVKFPGQPRAGERSDALVSNIDVMPTLLQTAACDTPRNLPGLDLMAHPEGHERVFAEAWGGSSYMVRSRDRKLILCQRDEQSLFLDLEQDPYEFDNLYSTDAYQEQVQQYRDELAHWALFDQHTRVHVDHSAPIIQGSNIPALDNGHWEEMQDYYREQMQTPPKLTL